MIARASQLFLPTLREPPADAEAASHKLLVRGGFIRQVGAGLFSFLPLGWRVHQKIVQIIRDEMDAIGGQEMLCPLLTPAELWETSGRYGIPEVFKFADRSGRPFVLALSHEETFTFHAREIQSYKQLPQILYHFSTKERDEPRPRGGLLRVREFIMKDSYSFDRDREGLDRSFELHEGAYRRIFERCGLEVYEVLAESGIMGGRESWDYLAPTGSGGNELVRCENGDYAADREAARGVPRRPDFPDPLPKVDEVETPGVATIEELAQFLTIDPAATSKAMPVVTTDGTLVLGLVRGDDKLNEEKLMSVFGGALVTQAASELGHIFKLDTYYSEPFGATYLDESGHEQLLVMGSYGIGPARTMAAIVEQHHDEQGIVWPASVAPYDAHVVTLPGLDAQGDDAAAALETGGLEVLLDDRDQRAGEKFADADLIGCPIRVTVGKKTLDDGAVDVRDRVTGDERRVPISELAGKVPASA